jgi:adenine-specific DNA-methyltransferase
MAKIDDLLAHVTDSNLRRELSAALAELRRQKKFGLVFEKHLPEMALLPSSQVRVGSAVVLRLDPRPLEALVVRAIDGSKATVVDAAGVAKTVSLTDLLLVKPFGEAVYPVLQVTDQLEGDPGRPNHVIINGENFYALQALRFGLTGKVDCIYIDPPFNTGARDWTYNNSYVDKADTWRHSKWLSFIERRLKLASDLLKPNGVLVVAIDENEANHLGLLLEDLFPKARRQLVSICTNPSGASGEGLSRVDEYAFFCFFGDALPVPTPDDMLLGDESSAGVESQVEWESLLRRGNQWYRKERFNLCYPVLIDPSTARIVRAGEPLPQSMADDKRPTIVDGFPAAWPVRRDGRLGIWRVDGKRLEMLLADGFVYASSFDDQRKTWTIRYLLAGTVAKIQAGEIEVKGRGPRGEALLGAPKSRQTIAKTLWHRGRHIAGGAYGTQLLSDLLGVRGAFPYPKSLYTTRDCLAVAIGDRQDALIVDFFGGSGTTLHATALMNAADGGRRRCVLVTNNEVDEKTTSSLNRRGVRIGDEEFEAKGIGRAVTMPRLKAAFSGKRSDGSPVEFAYIDGRPGEAGFDDNLTFFDLLYEERDAIDLGNRFASIVPSLWLAAGSCGQLPAGANATEPWFMPTGAGFAVLLDEDRFGEFAKRLSDQEFTHVWLVTDSEPAFARMRERLPNTLNVGMLYRDYLRNFRISSEVNR